MNGLFGINGLFGYLVAILLVVGAAIVFGIAAIKIQKEQATSYYKIENPHAIEMKDIKNKDYYHVDTKNEEK